MEILDIKENPDGSASMTMEISKEENRSLLEYAITNILKEEIEKYKDIQEGELK